MKATKAPGGWVPAPHQERLAAEYLAFVRATGLRTNRHHKSDFAAFCGQIGDPEDWSALSLDDQLAIPDHLRPVVTRLCLMGKIVPSPDFLIARQSFIASIASRHDPEFFAEFVSMAPKVGSSVVRVAPRDWERRQWNHLVTLAAVEGVSPRDITLAQLDAGREKLWRAARAQGRQGFVERVAMCHFEVAATLFHMGRIDTFPGRANLAAREPEFVGHQAMNRSPGNASQRSSTTPDSAATTLEPLVVVADGPPVLSPGAAAVLARIVRAYLARRRAADRSATGPDLGIGGGIEGRSGP